MNLTERAETKKETFYKLTNSADVPTAPSVGGRNLLSKTNQGKTNWAWSVSGGGTTAEDYNVDGINAVKLTRTSDASFSWHYIQYKGLLRNLIEPNTKYTLSFDVKPSVDVTFTAELKRGDDGAKLTNSATMNKATSNQWNKVSCVLTSKTTLPDDLSQVVYLSDMAVAKGNYLIIKNIKLEKSESYTPYSQAPEDLGWSTDTLVPTQTQRYLWKFEYIYYSDGSVKVTQPVNLSVAGQTGPQGPQGPTGPQGEPADPEVLEAFKKDLANTKTNVSELKTTTDGIVANVSKLDDATVKKATLNFDSNGLVVQAGKVVDGKTFATMISQDPENVKVIANKMEVTADMIVNGAITADKIRAGSITADMFKGNQITSLNGATTLNLYTGEIIFNNQNATINQIKGSYKSQISLFSLDDGAVTEGAWSSVNTLAFNSTKLTSATRRAGSTVDMFPNFSLMTLYGEKIAFTGETSGAPGPQNAIIVNTNSDEVRHINGLTNSSKGAWNYSMIMNFGTNAAISAPDIKLAGHIKSLTGILDDLCKKVGIMWI